jgi:ferric-chelate reductase [NAD(P)H]
LADKKFNGGEIDRIPFRKFGYGIYIISSFHGDKLNGQLANTVFQITSNPPQIAISISKNNLTHEMIMDSRRFSVSIVAEAAPIIFIGLFGFRSGRVINKFEKIKYKMGVTGCPLILENCVAALEAKVSGQYDAGSHTIFFGQVINSELFNEDIPMSYDYYQKYLKGKTPKDSPTFMPESISNQ